MNSGRFSSRISDGSIEGLKYAAALFMTGDHVNKYLFNGTIPYLYELGRLALPIFLFVMVYNLSRPGLLDHGGFQRTMARLLVFSAIACLPMYGLHTSFPLNVLASLFVLVVVIYFLERKLYWFAAITFIVLGNLVEFSWLGISLGLSIWLYLRFNSLMTAAIVILSCAGMAKINGNFWAIAAIPTIVAFSYFDLKIPRNKWFFYTFYPLHLGILWLIRLPMSKAGFLFFT